MLRSLHPTEVVGIIAKKKKKKKKLGIRLGIGLVFRRSQRVQGGGGAPD